MPTSIPVLIRLHVFYHACEEPHFGELELARRWPTRLQAEPWDALSEGCRNERPYGCDPHSFDARCGISEGIQKFLFPGEQGVGRSIKIGIPAPQVMAPLVGAFEIACGTLVVVGLLTRLVAIPLIIIMLVAHLHDQDTHFS